MNYSYGNNLGFRKNGLIDEVVLLVGWLLNEVLLCVCVFVCVCVCARTHAHTLYYPAPSSSIPLFS